MPTIAVDAAGSAEGIEAIVRGVAEVSVQTGIDCLLVGDQQRLQALLEQIPYNPEQIAIEHSPHDANRDGGRRSAGLFQRQGSPSAVCKIVAEGRAGAAVTTAPPAACLRAAARHFRPLSGVETPALAEVFPRRAELPGQDTLALLVDAGASARCTARDLVRFAAMGRAYARRVSKVASPRIGLLNMAYDEQAGGEPVAEAHRLLAAVPGWEFVGNITGADLVTGRADVVVCEGLLGAVAISLLDGVTGRLADLARAAAEPTLLWRMGLRFIGQGMTALEALIDYRRYGGAPILGYEQLLLVCRRRSDAMAMANAIKVAAKLVRDHVAADVRDAVNTVGR